MVAGRFVDRRSTKQRQSFPRTETFRNRQEVPQEIQQEIPQENSEKHPNNMFKVITYPTDKFQDPEFDGAVHQEVDLG